MKDIKELVSATETRRLGRIETLKDITGNKNKLYFKLYSGLASGHISTDEEAMRAIYGEPVSGSKYKMLKKRFKERLLTTILFLEPRKRSAHSYIQATYYCYKNFVIAKLLLSITLTYTGRKLMQKVLKKALQYQIYDVVLLSALNLRMEFMRMGDRMEYLHLGKIYNNALRILASEAQADRLYSQILIRFSRSFAEQPHLARQAEEAIKKITALRDKYKTFQLENYYFNIMLLYNELTHRYSDAISICDRFEEYLQHNQVFYTPVRHANILLKKMSCYLLLRNFDAGEQCAVKAMQLYRNGSENWFVLQELYFLLCINTRMYERATEIYSAVLRHERFLELRPQQQEIWRIMAGYLWFLLFYDHQEYLLEKYGLENKEFRMAKMLNEIPIFSQDKKGINVAVLILQILNLIQHGNYVDMITRNEALQNYLYKNLNEQESKRSNIFIKMLLSLEKFNFDGKKAEAQAAPMLAELKMEGMDYQAHQSRIEILPYEELWEMILSILKKQA